MLCGRSGINTGHNQRTPEPLPQLRFDFSTQNEISGFVATSNISKDTVLHIACQVGAKDVVKILLTHPGIKTDVGNCEDKDPKNCIARGFEDTMKLKFIKAQRGKELLNALSDGNISQAKALLEKKFTSQDLIRMGISKGFVKGMFEKQEFVEQMLNPNIQKGEIETPLSLIIKLCLQGITQDNKEVLTKLLKHKDLDFSQIKPIPPTEQNLELKQTFEQAITERLTDTIRCMVPEYDGKDKV